MYLINSAWERARETVEGKWNSKEEKNIFTGENVDIYIKKKKAFQHEAVQLTCVPISRSTDNSHKIISTAQL